MSEFIETPTEVGQAPASLTEVSWLSPYIAAHEKQEVSKIEIVDFSGMGGLHATMKKVNVEFASGLKKSYIFKTILPAGLTRSQQLGTARESFFYHHFAPTLAKAGVSLPSTPFVYGNMETGDKCIVMEDLSNDCVQSGYFFGPYSPLNWQKDLAKELKNRNLPTEYIASVTFTNAAKFHAKYWGDKTLEKFGWLRGQKWMKNEGKDSWDASQNTAINGWKSAKDKMDSGKSTVNWNPKLVECMDASIKKISWETYQENLKTLQWTLVHGDFHPANIMWRWDLEKIEGKELEFPNMTKEEVYKIGSSVLLDWEVIGVGSGPQDLAQYFISHANPETRRNIEMNLLQEYYNNLIKFAQEFGKDLSKDSYPFSKCLEDYVSGGVERWVWMLALLAQMCPDIMVQYFHDQLIAFIDDHNVTPESIGMPRV